MRSTRKLLPAVLALAGMLAATAADAQSCMRDGRRGMVVGDLGYSSLSCRGSCSISTSDRDGDVEMSAMFSQPPVVRGIRSGSGLREGDAIVSIDGRSITADGAGTRLVNVRPGERVRLGIRRDGQTREVTVRAGERCDVPLRAPQPPRPPRATRPPQPMRPAAPPAPREPEELPPGLFEPAEPRAPAAPPAPRRPTAVRPPAPPPSPPRVLPQGWFGFGVRCERCSFDYHRNERTGTERSSVRFTDPPEVWSVEPGTPAHRAGMRNGDRLLRIDGVGLTTGEGERRFAAVRPGQAVTWTYERDGQTLRSRMVATRRPDAPRATGGTRTAAASSRLRYSGRVAGAQVEVRGAPVTVDRDHRTGELVIRSADLTVRVKPEPEPESR